VPDVRYVCLSDLHFGAENSILTRLDPDTLRVDHTKPSPALEGLLACLRSVTERNEGSRKPTLILAGDIFELALARDNDAAMVFEMFVQQALGPDGIFDSNVYFIPGNHDHHLWEGVREKQYSDYVRARPPTEQLEPPWHVTRMRETATQRQVSSDLVTSLLDRALGQRSGVNVRVVYPNLALDTPSSNRHVFIHHGQFLEAMYTIMSTARDMVFPNQLPPPWTETPVWAWEAENFAWIDFFWSTLGRSGAVGRDVGVIYASLQSLDALRPLNRNLARGLAGRARPKILQRMYARVLAWVFDAIAKKGQRLERGRREAVLSPEAQVGLHRYLESPLLDQIKREYKKEYGELQRVPGDVTFVFGHTHKPFEAVRRFVGYENPVCVYNTGGWVVDSTEPRPLHGAAAVLFDDDLNSASLRFFNQSSDRSSYCVGVAHCGAPNPFAAKLDELVQPDEDPWKSFSRVAAELVEERHQALYRIIAQVQGVAPRRRAGWRTWRERHWGTR